MPGATSRPPTTVMGQIMATFALPKDNDKDKDKHKDQDLLDKRPDPPLQELQSLKREPAKAACELAKLVKHVCLEQFIGQLINSSLRPVDNYLYLIVVPITLMTNS